MTALLTGKKTIEEKYYTSRQIDVNAMTTTSL